MNSSRPLPFPDRAPLRPDYYLANFRTALDWLSTRYADLLSEEETSFIATFAALSRRSQALLVRLLMRRGDCFRFADIRYEEIGSITEAAAPLIELQWLDSRPELQAADLFRLLKLEELRHVFPALRAATKKELQARVSAQGHAPRTLEQWTGDPFDGAYRVRAARLCARLRVLFFGSFHQQWSAFVVADLGIYKYEQVALLEDSRVFHSRADIESFYRLHDCHELMEADAAIHDVLATLPSAPLENAWLESLRAQLLFDLGRCCERDANIDLALDLYRRSSNPEAMVRALRIRERRGEHALAYEELRGIPIANAREEQLLGRIRVRLERRLNGVRVTRAKSAHMQSEMALQYVQERCRIEERVRREIHTPLSPAFYIENALMNSLVGLLCWEAIFAPLAGAFFHRFHVGPLDLDSPNFRARRASFFDAALQRLDDGTYADFIRRTYSIKRGTASPFVRWGSLDASLLELALLCIPADHLRVFCEWIFADVRENTAGFPDLIQFYPEQRRYRMIEVKGPGDRLQDNQRRWFERCMEHRLPIEVVHVRWSGAAPPRKRRAPVQLDAFEGWPHELAATGAQVGVD